MMLYIYEHVMRALATLRTILQGETTIITVDDDEDTFRS